MSVADRNKPVDTLPLSGAQIAQLNGILDRRKSDAIDSNHRDFSRHAFSSPTRLVVTVQHPGGRDARYFVIARDISEQGACFLHGESLSPGSSCILMFPTHDKRWYTCSAQVKRCDFIHSRIHEVGVRFLHHVDPSRYALICHKSDQDRLVPRPRLTGRVMQVTPSAGLRNHIRACVAKIGPHVFAVADCSEATRLLTHGVSMDVVTLGWDQSRSVSHIAQDIATLRHGSWTGPIIVACDGRVETETDDHKKLEADVRLTGPFDADGLAQAFVQFMPLAEATR